MQLRFADIIPPAAIGYAALSCVAFLLYAVDKSRARRGARRISERTLHLVELLGGWPGAWLAARSLRHKTSKTSYRIVFALIVLLHFTAWTLLAMFLR